MKITRAFFSELNYSTNVYLLLANDTSSLYRDSSFWLDVYEHRGLGCFVPVSNNGDFL